MGAVDVTEDCNSNDALVGQLLGQAVAEDAASPHTPRNGAYAKEAGLVAEPAAKDAQLAQLRADGLERKNDKRVRNTKPAAVEDEKKGTSTAAIAPFMLEGTEAEAAEAAALVASAVSLQL